MSGAVLGVTFSTGGGGGGGLTAEVNFTAAGGTGYAPGTARSDPIICTGVNGVPPYTYLWTYVSGDTDIFATRVNESTTRFSRYISAEGTFTGVWKCVVTDSAAATADSPPIDISLEGSV